jgi:protein-S-isoprenylcysteine O-methyltransferase Ste14
MAWIDKGVDALALGYAMLFVPGPFFWLIIHPGIKYWRRFGNRSFWVALPLWLGCAAALVEWRGELFAARLPRNALTWILGIGLIALAFWMDRAVRREFSLRRIVGLPEMHPERPGRNLVRSGIYRRVRHPRYDVFMLTFWGLAFLTGAEGIFLLAIIEVLMYLLVTSLEEKELRDHFGLQYEAYAREVPRFFPRLRPKPQPENL